MPFKPAGVDVAVQVTPAGKLDLVLDAAGPNKGNFRFDNSRAHTVMSIVTRKKGRYYYDRTGQSGTLLYTVKDDRTTTLSRFQSYVEDGAEQVQQKKKITTYQVKVQKVRSGSYRIGIGWTVPGSSAPQTLLDSQGAPAQFQL